MDPEKIVTDPFFTAKVAPVSTPVDIRYARFDAAPAYPIWFTRTKALAEALEAATETAVGVPSATAVARASAAIEWRRRTDVSRMASSSGLGRTRAVRPTRVNLGRSLPLRKV